jgi:hypothetical protein
MPGYVPAGNCCNRARVCNPSAGWFPRSTESLGGRWWPRCARTRQTCAGCAPTYAGCRFTTRAWSAAGCWCLAWFRWALAKDPRRPRSRVPVRGLGSMGAGGGPEKTRHRIAEVRKRAVGLAIGYQTYLTYRRDSYACAQVLNAEEEEDRAPDTGFAGNVARTGMGLACFGV